MRFRAFLIGAFLGLVVGPAFAIADRSPNGGQRQTGVLGCPSFLVELSQYARKIDDLAVRDRAEASRMLIKLLLHPDVQTLIRGEQPESASDGRRRTVVVELADLMHRLSQSEQFEMAPFDEIVNKIVLRSDDPRAGGLAEAVGDLFLAPVQNLESSVHVPVLDVRELEARNFYQHAEDAYCKSGECADIERVRKKKAELTPQVELKPSQELSKLVLSFSDLLQLSRTNEFDLVLKLTKKYTSQLALSFQEPYGSVLEKNFERLYLIGLMRLNALIKENQIPEALELLFYLRSMEFFIPIQSKESFHSFQKNLWRYSWVESYAPGLRERLDRKFKSGEIIGQLPQNAFWYVDYITTVLGLMASKYSLSYEAINRAIKKLQDFPTYNLRPEDRDRLIANMEEMKVYLQQLEPLIVP